MDHVPHEELFAQRDSFQVYGVTFRWLRPGSSTPHRGSAIPLVSESSGLVSSEVRWLTRARGTIPAFGLESGSYVYRFKNVADFWLPPDARLLRIFVDPEANPSTLSFVLLRGILPRLLQLRGVRCLHASAVRVGKSLAAFVGPSGSGKSTLVAGLVARGFPLVTDDVLPIRLTAKGVVKAGPGLCELRLYKKAAELAGVAADLVPPRRGQTKGLWIPEAQNTTTVPAELGKLYVLSPRRGDGDRNFRRVRELSPIRALLAVASNSFWLHPTETEALAGDMRYFASVVRLVPVVRLPFDFTRKGLDAVARMIAAC